MLTETCFSVVNRKIKAQCFVGEHNNEFVGAVLQKCHMDRSCPQDSSFDVRRIKGRPIDLLALWLKKAAGTTSKLDRAIAKTNLAKPEFHEERRQARAEVWDLRHDDPHVNSMFEVEAKVPDEMLGDVPPHLWEPLHPF